jgi:hypothetical protein
MSNIHDEFESYVTDLHDQLLSTPRKAPETVQESRQVLRSIQTVGESVEAEMKAIVRSGRDLSDGETSAVIRLTTKLRDVQANELIWLHGLQQWESRTSIASAVTQ